MDDEAQTFYNVEYEFNQEKIKYIRYIWRSHTVQC